MISPPKSDRILHLGLGAFHRAHQAWYLHRLARQGAHGWTLAGGNLRPDAEDVMAALAAQNGQYTLEMVSPDGTRTYERVESIGQVVPWNSGLEPLVALGARADTRIISFTVTEAGYHFGTHGGLDAGSADLASDLAGGTPRTIYGAISAILRRRMDQGCGPLTLLSCDNLRGNGGRFRHGFLEFLALRNDRALSEWFETHVSCPNSMVDRITPRPSSSLRQRVAAATGREDAEPVMSEGFAQWVIEDRFVAGRPSWEDVGVQMVDDVAPFEEAKIRILNGSHSGIAWAGSLRGHSFIHESVADLVVNALVRDYITDNVIPCLQPSPMDLAAYRDTILDRFSNPYIEDSNARVASDSFAKLPEFIVPTIRERMARNLSIEAAARVAALFFFFLDRNQRGLIPFEYKDQAMDPALLASLLKDPEPMDRFSEIPVLWGGLAGNGKLKVALRRARKDVEALLASG